MKPPAAVTVHRRPASAVDADGYFAPLGRRLWWALTLVRVLARLCVWHVWLPQEQLMQAVGARKGHRQSPAGEEVPAAAELANRIAWFIYRLPGFRRRACYWRSLMICEILARYGWGTRLHVGTRHEGDELQVHLWVTSGGELLGDDPRRCERFVEIAAYAQGGGG